jgi:methionyl-tRNA formyltransferase
MALLKFIESKPRIVFFAGGNIVANKVLSFLTSRRENLIHVFNEKDEINAGIVTSYLPDVIITCYWPYLLKPEMINIPKYGCINFHPALLPKNRGWYPSVWEVLIGGTAGVTLHLIDEGADTGPIIAQREFPIKETDTGGTVYEKSQSEIISLFEEIWIKLLNEGIELKNQDHSRATYHTKKETNSFDEIHLDREYVGKYILNLIRAKTFNDKGFAYYRKDGKKYRITINITEENE